MKNKVLVLDVEMTCWEEPTDQTPEIIQIGVVEVDMIDLEITRERMMYVVPESTEISEYCTKLTGITKRQVYKQGFSYDKAVQILNDKFGFKTKTVFGWGNDNLAFRDGINNYVNLSALYTMIQGTDTKYNLETAMGAEGLKFDGNAHDALVDARNTAKLLIHLFELLRWGHIEDG